MGSVAGRCWGLQDKCRRGRPTTRDTLLATHTAAAKLRARLDRFGTQAGAVDVDDDDDDDGDYAARRRRLAAVQICGVELSLCRKSIRMVYDR